MQSNGPASCDELGTPASWIIRNRLTGAVVSETFSPAVVAKLNTAKYEAVPALAYLQSLSSQANA